MHNEIETITLFENGGESIMDRYEYKEIIYRFPYEEKRQSGKTGAESLLNEAGADGWKLVGMDHDSWEKTHFILIRKKDGR